MKNTYPLLILSLLVPNIAFGMTCVSQKLKHRYESADFVFEATVKKREKIQEKSNGICWNEGETCGSKIATVEIGEIWKGNFNSTETKIYSEDGCYCLGTYFPVGSKYLVFGKKSESEEFEVYDMGACSTEPYQYVKSKTLKKLKKYKKRANKFKNENASKAGTDAA